jgi:hypothetical protein
MAHKLIKIILYSFPIFQAYLILFRTSHGSLGEYFNMILSLEEKQGGIHHLEEDN